MFVSGSEGYLLNFVLSPCSVNIFCFFAFFCELAAKCYCHSATPPFSIRSVYCVHQQSGDIMFFVGTKLKIWEWTHKNSFSLLNRTDVSHLNRMQWRVLSWIYWVSLWKHSFCNLLRFVSYKLICWYKQVSGHYLSPPPGICLWFIINDKWNDGALSLCWNMHRRQCCGQSPRVIDHTDRHSSIIGPICVRPPARRRHHKETYTDQTHKERLQSTSSILSLEKLLFFLFSGEGFAGYSIRNHYSHRWSLSRFAESESTTEILRFSCVYCFNKVKNASAIRPERLCDESIDDLLKSSACRVNKHCATCLQWSKWILVEKKLSKG